MNSARTFLRFKCRVPAYLLLFFCIQPFSNLFSQDQFFRIRLSDFAPEISLKGYYIERVINVTDDGAIIGFVQRGMANKKQAAVLDPSVEADVTTFLQAALTPSDGAIPLIIRVNKIFIYEVTASADWAFADLNLSFIRHDGSRLVHLFDAGISMKKSSIDATGAHVPNLIKCFDSCFANFEAAVAAHRTYDHEITQQDLLKNPLSDPGSFPVFQSGPLPKGILRTFNDFRDAHADTTVHFQVKYHESRSDSDLVRARLTYPVWYVPKPCWGFSDGKDVFMKIESNYYRLKREKDRFVSFIGYKSQNGDAGAIIIAGGILGGIAGALIAAAATSAMPSVKGAYKGEVESDYFIVDFSNGELTTPEVPEFLRVESRTVFFLSKTSPEDEPVTIFINGEYKARLTRGQYFETDLPSRCQEIPVKLVSASGLIHEETLPANLFMTTSYIIHVKGKNEVSLDRAKGEVKSTLEKEMNEKNTIQ
jgi:hypothetical protein